MQNQTNLSLNTAPPRSKANAPYTIATRSSSTCQNTQYLLCAALSFWASPYQSVIGNSMANCFRWPKLEIAWYYDYTSIDQGSDYIYVINYDDDINICKINTEMLYDGYQETNTSYFINRYIKYIIKDRKISAIQYSPRLKIKSIFQSKLNINGLSEDEAKKMRKGYGEGIMMIQKPTLTTLFFKELFRPIYIFLMFAVGSQIWQNYYLFVYIIAFSSVLGIGLTLHELIEANERIFAMAYNEIMINVRREGHIINISSKEIVPGDIVFLKDSIKIPFQGIILEGQALINESMLTGESVPVLKKAQQNSSLLNQHSILDKACFVYQGTTVVQVNSKKKMTHFQEFREHYGIPVFVTRTNFITVKGQLIRTILYPKELETVFQKDSTKFLFFLFGIGLVTYLFLVIRSWNTISSTILLKKGIDLVVIIVPPTLPVSMTVGILLAVSKLKKKGINCISPNKVISGGIVDAICFDKTGTLTEDFMDFYSLVPSKNKSFQPQILNKQSERPNISSLLSTKQYLYNVLMNMASNHSISSLDVTNELVGDPMEIKLFEYGEFQLINNNSDPNIIFGFSSASFKGDIYKRFQFQSELQRMSVICEDKNKRSQFYVYTKGSPEALMKIMKKNTIPDDYLQKLKYYTSSGLRVLAIASKKYESSSNTIVNIGRSEVQSDLQFNGFQIFENKLKPPTAAAIKQLRKVDLDPVMITGDNALTGTNIGYRCNIIDPNTKTLILDLNLNRQITVQEFIYRDNTSENNGNQTIASHYSGPKILFSKAVQDETSFDSFVSDQIVNQNYNLCLTGQAFNYLFMENQLIRKDLSKNQLIFLDKARIYARTKPGDKAKIVMLYQSLNKTVAMCGDGANDCAALKVANLGLSLSQAQASISAPFTATEQNISSMVQLIKQCRAGLATNFCIFDTMAMYSLIQYTSDIICMYFYSYNFDSQFAYWDVACNLAFVMVVGYTETADTLSKQKPKSTLFSRSNVIQILTMFVIQAAGQIMMIVAISGLYSEDIQYQKNGGFAVNLQRYNELGDYTNNCPETNVIFLFSIHMYIFSILAFFISKPWRKEFYTNLIFTIILVLVFSYNVILDVFPALRLQNLQLTYMTSDSLNMFILFSGLGIGVLMYTLQKFVMEPCFAYLDEKKKKEHQFQILQQ